jgi:hypothetical protein
VLVCGVNELKTVISPENVSQLQKWKRIYDFMKVQPNFFSFYEQDPQTFLKLNCVICLVTCHFPLIKIKYDAASSLSYESELTQDTVSIVCGCQQIRCSFQLVWL